MDRPKMATAIWFVLIVFLYMSHRILAMQVIPERAMKRYINEKYLLNGTIFIKRHGRNSRYCVNFEGTTKMTFANNVSLHLIFFELMNNEYKPSFVAMHWKICDLVNSDPYVGKTLANGGLVCPLPPGYHKFHNLTVKADDFPNVWPFERAKIEASLTQSPTNDLIAAADIFILFKQNPRRG